MTLQPLCSVHSCHLVGSNTVHNFGQVLSIVCCLSVFGLAFCVAIDELLSNCTSSSVVYPYKSPVSLLNLFVSSTPSWHSFLVIYHPFADMLNSALFIELSLTTHENSMLAFPFPLQYCLALLLLGITQVLSIVSITSSTAHPLCWADLSSSLTCT